MKSLDPLSAYVFSFDPEFPERARGAPPEQIESLERLVGRALPESYRTFLSGMGLDDGGLYLHSDCATKITDVIGVYKAAGGKEVVSGGILIGLGLVDLALDMSGSGEPRVVVAESGRAGRIYADSLEKLLFRRAFITYRLEALPHLRTYSRRTTESLVARGEEIAEGLGFGREWFSDPVVSCAQSERGVVRIQQDTGILFVTLACRQEDDIGKLGPAFVEGLRMQPI